MLSGLLITIDIIVCMALVAVVLLQRSEGGAFGMGGGPTGLVTARGAGDLLTRTTWVLFGIFLALSLALTLLAAHDRATSSVLEKLKLQTANTNALDATPANTAVPLTAPAPAGAPPVNPLSGSLFGPTTTAPKPAPLAAPAPQPIAPPPATASKPAGHAAAKPAEAAPPAQSAAPPVLEPPAPKPLPAAPASPAPGAPASGTP
jgi:preprotein translocase subunit SecG